MPERLPRVSVIVPVHDGAATIGTCLDALGALDYPRHLFEVVVVDNRSTDATRTIAGRYPVQVVAEDDVQSSYAARNRGVLAATGSVLAFTDADCVPERGWLRALVAPFAAAEVGGVAGAIEPFAASSTVERYQARRAIRAERAFAHPVLPFAQTANAAYPRDLVVALGGFDPRIPFGGDLDFSWRLQRRTGRRLVYASDALVRHRHRTTWRGLAALYEKNAIANCLLAERHAYYADYPEVRTLAYCARECLRSLVRGMLRMPAAAGGPDDHLASAVRYAGEMRGWLRWHAGRVRIPDVGASYPLADDRTAADAPARPIAQSARATGGEAWAR